MPTYFTYIVLFAAAFISGLIVMLIKPKLSSNLKLLLSFSGAFLLAICILHLIPELYEDYHVSIGIFVIVGFVLQLLLEFFSDGIEHGHFHSHDKKTNLFPYAVFISLCLHSFIEGMALFENHDTHSNYPLLVGIIIHKIPIAIVLTTMFLAKNASKTSLLTALVIFSLSGPIGLFIANTLGSTWLNNVNILLAIAVGVFLHISTTILFESSEEHRFHFKKFAIIIVGFIAAILTLL